MGHTPGPWRSQRIGYWEVFSGDTPICRLFIQKDEQENAHLIAAAPDLLKICKQILEEGDVEYVIELELKAAIDKAEGRVDEERTTENT